MTLYSVYARDQHIPKAIADRFSWFAALLPPVYALVHGVWLLLLGWVVAMVVLGMAASWIGGTASFWSYVAMATWVGLEAPGWRASRLARKGWAYRTEIVAADPDQALLSYLRQA